MAAPYFLSSDHGPVIRIKLNDWVNIIADASKPTTLSTSITVGTGQKTITVPTDRAFGPGQSIRIARTSDPSNVWMQGTVISYSGTSLVVLVASTSGSGTYSDWTITLVGGGGTPASVSEIRALTGSNTVTPSVIASAYANAGILSGTGTINFDWRDLITDTVTLTGNRLLANPTNVIPGTERVIRVKGNNTTARLLSFGANFKGPLPQISVTNNREIALFLYAVAADVIVVRAVNLYAWPILTITAGQDPYETYIGYVRPGTDAADQIGGSFGSISGDLLPGVRVDAVYTFIGFEATYILLDGDVTSSVPSAIYFNGTLYSPLESDYVSPYTYIIFTSTISVGQSYSLQFSG